MAEKVYQLIVEHGPDIGKIFPLQREKLIIGRDPVADIILVDPEISRQHARLVRGETGYHIEDLNSTNGTVINGQRLRDELVPLQDGAEIMVGSGVMLRYRVTLAGAGERQTAFSPGSSQSDRQPLIPLPPEQAEEEPEPVSAPTSPSEEIEAAFPPSTMVREESLDILDQTTVSEPDPPPLAEPERPTSQPLVAQENGRRRRRNVTMVAAVVVIILCLCALALSAYFWWGDPLMNALGVY